jgi:hypothetical protein
MRGARAGSVAVVVCLLGAPGACGGSGGGSPVTPPPPSPHRIDISSSGQVTPVELVVPPGTRVLFVNNDTRPHNMTSDPHPEHNLCPEINQVGLLNAGQSKETGNLVTVRTCGFHDHDNPDNTALHGRVVIR